MHHISDSDLVARIQNGTISAYEQLVKRYEQPLCAFAYRILGNEKDAQDVVQESLFSIYQTIDRIDRKKKISTYFFEIVKNAALSRIRSRKREVPLDEASDIADDEVIFTQLIVKEEQQVIRKAIHTLDAKYRLVILLYYFEDLSYEEISKKCRMPINTVRTNIRRAKQQLKKIICI